MPHIIYDGEVRLSKMNLAGWSNTGLPKAPKPIILAFALIVLVVLAAAGLFFLYQHRMRQHTTVTNGINYGTSEDVKEEE